MIGLQSEKLQKFFDKLPVRSYPKGQILLMPGDTVDYAYLIVSGNVKAYNLSYKGDQVILGLFDPNTVFPVPSIINKTPNSYYFQTLTKTKLRAAPAKELLDFIEQDRALSMNILGQSLQAIERATQKINRLMSGNARDLIIYELLNELRFNGQIDADGAYAVLLSEHELGSRVGLTRETVSREINKLKHLGLLRGGRGKIVFTDVMELETRLQNFS